MLLITVRFVWINYLAANIRVHLRTFFAQSPELSSRCS